MNNRELIERDLTVNWHPCTQMKDHQLLPLIPIKEGEGVYLYDFDGNRYLDAISSWWVNLFGHRNPYINQKIKEQLERLEHVIFAGFTHEGAVRLGERITRLTGLDKVFYGDNGSSAVEISLKMSFHYWKNRGEIRPIFFSLENSYHGETIGALSVGDLGLYKETYRELLFQNIPLPIPKDQSESEARRALERAEFYFKAHRGEVSALIIEPLVQCAGFMKMHSPLFVKGLRELCDRYNVHLILDEIAVGFGRTGTLFAFEQAGILPDFLCLSKGLTGGYLPLSLVVTTDEIYRAFYCDYTEFKAFLHSHSYTGNPLAVAAANATLDIFENNPILERNRQKSQYIWEQLEQFRELPNVKEVRQTGMIGAVEMIDYPVQERRGLVVYQYGLEKGVLLRPLGNVIYFMPPYTISLSEIDLMMEVAYNGIKLAGEKKWGG
ncbi:MAG: adenosylmethionine--8-amino-7-oxononanoate transaminase [Campylobacterales bacterium]